MSELKAYTYDDMIDGDADTNIEYYPKSEADKVIADLEESNKMEVEQLLILNREQANAANRLRDSMERVIRHNKYKRCLAKANWCEIRSRYYDLLIKVEASYLLSNPHNVHKYERKAFRSKYWCIKWLELADKFKEGK